VILFISGGIYLTIMIATAFGKQAATEPIVPPIAESIQDVALTPEWLDRWAPWLYGTIALVVVAYGPQLIEQIGNIALKSPGFKPW
jgi:cytochrome c oxidase subunit 1